jgi:hypothetical protein
MIIMICYLTPVSALVATSSSMQTRTSSVSNGEIKWAKPHVSDTLLSGVSCKVPHQTGALCDFLLNP